MMSREDKGIVRACIVIGVLIVFAALAVGTKAQTRTVVVDHGGHRAVAERPDTWVEHTGTGVIGRAKWSRWWGSGRVVGVETNLGDLSQLREQVIGERIVREIDANGDSVELVRVNNARIECGTSLVEYVSNPELKLRPRDQPFIDYLFMHAPPRDVFPPGYLASIDSMKETKANTSPTGSNGLVTDRDPLVMAMLYRAIFDGKQPTDAQHRGWQKRVIDESRRGLKYWWHRADGKSVQFLHLFEPKWAANLAYNKSSGSWTTSYSSPLPPGYGEHWRAGDAPPDDQHYEGKELVSLGLFFNDPAARDLSFSLAEAAASWVFKASLPQCRSAYALELWAEVYGAYRPYYPDRVEHIRTTYIPRLIAQIRDRTIEVRYAGGLHFLTWPDFGSQGSDGGHMTPEQIRDWFPGTGESQAREAAKSQSSWMSGNLWRALQAVEILAPPYDVEGRRNLRYLMNGTASMMLDFGRPAYEEGTYKLVEPVTVWNDMGVLLPVGKSSVPAPLAMDRGQGNTVKGVYIRFLAAAYIRLGHWLMDQGRTQDALECFDNGIAMAEYCEENGRWWNGKDWRNMEFMLPLIGYGYRPHPENN